MSNVFVGYNPGDFFYNSINNTDVSGTIFHLKPTKEECNELYKKEWKDNTCSTWFHDNSLNCIKYQICKNEENVNTINKLDDKHNSEYAKNTINQAEFYDTIVNTFNFSIGIIFVFFVIYKIKK